MMLRLLLVILIQAVAAAAHPVEAQSEVSRISGQVVDASGAPVAGAIVTAEATSRAEAAETAGDGRFSFGELPDGEVRLTALAPGFAEATERVVVASGMPAPRVVLVLRPAPIYDTITVTASRGAARFETASSVSVLTSAELLNAAPGALDDVLRATPGFSLFRRSSSRVANPTTQGVTLRGVSGSGASRTLVLADGLPLNDPFGSWVYWNKIPLAAIDRVEIVRGATGDLYGADALGGVIQVLTFTPSRPQLRATADVASFATRRVSAFGGAARQGWSGAFAAEALGTDGVSIVARDDRGPVDTPANSRYRTAFGTLGYDAGDWRASLRASGYREERDNGTPLQVNDTSWRQLSGDAAGLAGGGAWLARAAAGSQDYFQTFSAVAVDRASERLTTEQDTPSTFGSAAVQYARPWGSHTILTGGELKRTSSTVTETRYTLAGSPLGPFAFGGTEVSGAVFGRVHVTANDRTGIVLGARGDFWSSDPDDTTQPSHSVAFFSPRVSLVYQLNRELSLQTSVYRAHRTPTLNELHRGFRVGNVVTDPNPLLEPERLTGVEGGLLFARPQTSARVTAFWNRLDDAIANITLSVTPALISRQRQNADTVRAAGLEVEADIRPHGDLTLSALAVVTASVFRDTPGQPAISGNRVPQVPRYQLGAGATWTPRALTLSGQLRILGRQFDDDLNQLPLGGFTVLDLFGSRAVGRGAHAFVAAENVFDAEYDVGRTPVRTVGWPRTVRAGVRLFLP